MEAVNKTKNLKEMNLLQNLKIIILIIVAILILIIFRISDQNVFKESVKTAMEVTQNNSNIIKPGKFRELKSAYLVIQLGSESQPDSFQFQSSVKIPFERLLDKVNREILDKTKGTLILYSDEIAISSKAWIILNQLGYKNILILTAEENPEELKYKFQPDTTAGLEQDSI